MSCVFGKLCLGFLGTVPTSVLISCASDKSYDIKYGYLLLRAIGRKAPLRRGVGECRWSQSCNKVLMVKQVTKVERLALSQSHSSFFYYPRVRRQRPLSSPKLGFSLGTICRFMEFQLKAYSRGFPGCPVVKNSSANEGDMSSVPGLGTMLWGDQACCPSAQILSPYSRACKPQLWKPLLCNKRSHCTEKPTYCNKKQQQRRYKSKDPVQPRIINK